MVVDPVQAARADTGEPGSIPGASTLPGPGTVVALDIETTSLDPETGMVVCAALAWAGGEALLWVEHETAPGRRWSVPEVGALAAGWRLVCHNAAFDLQYLAAHGGGDLWPALLLDTMVGAHALDATAESLSLKALSIDLLNADAWGWNWQADGDLREADPEELERYALADVRQTLALRDYLRQELAPGPRRVLSRVSMPALVALQRLRGMPLDLGALAAADERLAAAEAEHGAALDALARRLAPGAEALCSEDLPKSKRCKRSWAAGARFFRRVMAEVAGEPLNLTPAGKACWDRENLQRLALGVRGALAAGLAKEVLAHRDAQKARQFGVSWREHMDGAGRVRPDYSMTRTRTGRLACSRPNLQQVPRRGGLRSAFVAPPGMDFVECDLSQIELRLASVVYGIPEMRTAFEVGEDLHTVTARRMTGAAEVTKEERSRAKVVNFALLYSAGPRGLRRYAFVNFGLDMSMSEAEEACEAFHAAYPGLRAGHRRIIAQARQDLYVEHMLGRRLPTPHIRSWDGLERGRAERQAVNFPVQGLAADLLMLALPRLVDWADTVGGEVVGTVHDSVLLLVPEGTDAEPVRAIMEGPDLGPWGLDGVGVPLVADLTVARSWGG